MRSDHESSAEWARTAALVRAGAPETPEFTAAHETALWARISAVEVVQPQRRRWRPAVVAVIAAAAIGAAGVAGAAAMRSAHTGQGPVDAEDAELGGPGERLDPTGADFAAVLDEITSDIRFPSVQAREKALAWEYADNQVEPAAVRDRGETRVSAGALRLWVSGHALCAWTNSWARAERVGDAAAQAEATTMILSARSWPAISDTDPELAGESEFAWLPALEQAVRTHDLATARSVLGRTAACAPGLGPELGLEPW